MHDCKSHQWKVKLLLNMQIKPSGLFEFNLKWWLCLTVFLYTVNVEVSCRERIEAAAQSY